MSRVRAIVAGHGDFAAGLISAVVQITGRDDAFRGMSNRAMSAIEVGQALGQLLDQTGAQVVFTDLPAGSCTMAARRLQRERPALVVGVGVNLAVLLDFLFDDSQDDEAARRAIEKGAATLMMVGGPARGH